MPSSVFLPIGPHSGRLTEDYSHNELHDGHVFRNGVYEVIGAGSTLSVLITTPANSDIHIFVGIETNGPGLGYFSESPDATGGTVITAKNGYRDSTNASTLIIAKDPTITTTGTSIGVSIIGSSGFKETSGGTALSEEWILKHSTKYLLRFTADAASCRTVLKTIWLEG